MKTSFFVQVLWERGHSGLWRFDSERKGIIFSCWETVTSMPVGGFDAYGEGVEVGETSDIDEYTQKWEVFVPFGTTCYLHWLGQWDVVVISTYHGPLEIASEWIGGGDSCYQAFATLPNGETLEIEDLSVEPRLIASNVAAHWEAAFETYRLGDKFVKIHLEEKHWPARDLIAGVFTAQ